MGEQKTIRVLVADDNPHIRSIVGQALERMKPPGVRFEFTEATGGDEALAALEGELDLAILDVWMPVVDGVRLVDRIRAKPRTQTLPILVVSSGGEEAQQDALAAGADLFLPKPLRLVDVQDAVRTLLKI